jgi:hypothetical protein
MANRRDLWLIGIRVVSSLGGLLLLAAFFAKIKILQPYVDEVRVQEMPDQTVVIFCAAIVVMMLVAYVVPHGRVSAVACCMYLVIGAALEVDSTYLIRKIINSTGITRRYGWALEVDLIVITTASWFAVWLGAVFVDMRLRKSVGCG